MAFISAISSLIGNDPAKVAIGYSPLACEFGLAPAKFWPSFIPFRAIDPAYADGFKNSPDAFLWATAWIVPFIYDWLT